MRLKLFYAVSFVTALLMVAFLLLPLPEVGAQAQKKQKKRAIASDVGRQVGLNGEPVCDMVKTAAQRKNGKQMTKQKSSSGESVYSDSVYLELAKQYRKSVAQLNCNATEALGDLYFYGRGVKQDYTAAASLYRRVPDTYTNAKNRLATLYQNGRGVEPDSGEALRLYALAAKAGNATAQDNMGRVAEFGWFGTTPNYVNAAEWYRLSADRGNTDAASELQSVKARLNSAQAAEVAAFERNEDAAKARVAEANAQAAADTADDTPPSDTRVTLFDGINAQLKQQQDANQARINATLDSHGCLPGQWVPLHQCISTEGKPYQCGGACRVSVH